MSMKYVGIFITILVLFVIAGLLFSRYLPSSPGKTTMLTPTPTRAKETIVNLTNEGFNPKDVRIKVNEAVRFINQSSEQASVNSDDHPTHTKHKEINFGIFEKDSTFMYMFTKPGVYGYHNHFQPEQTGTITVEN